MSYRVLIADDEAHWRSIARDFLASEGYDVLEAENGAQAVSLLRSHSEIAVVILDVMMPVMDGINACREMRSFSSVPILMVTALDDEDTELNGFSCGADEYICKPVRMRPFLARVNALIKRTAQQNTSLELGDLSLDLGASAALIRGARVPLTPKEYDLLVYLAQNRNIAKSREQILHAVWNTEFYGDARTVDTHVKNLRMKLGDQGDLIRTVRGRGYILEYRG